MSDAALVTCLIDLSRRDPARGRDAEWYLRQCDVVLGSRHSLVAYVEPDLVDTVAALRARLAPDRPTTIVPMSFDDLPHARFVGEVERAYALGRRPESASNLLKDTPDYVVLGWSKPQLLLDASNRMHEIDAFWWVDLALTTAAPEPEPGALDALLDRPVTGVRANVIWETSADEYRDRAHFHRTNPYSRIAGGLFASSNDRVSRFTAIFEEEVAACLASGWPTIDEPLLGITVDRMRHEAELSYAPWEAMLTDVDGPVTAAWHRLRLLRDCRSRGLDDRARLHATAVRTAHERGVIELTAAELDEISTAY